MEDRGGNVKIQAECRICIRLRGVKSYRTAGGTVFYLYIVVLPVAPYFYRETSRHGVWCITKPRYMLSPPLLLLYEPSHGSYQFRHFIFVCATTACIQIVS